jgi:hypothetical protein
VLFFFQTLPHWRGLRHRLARVILTGFLLPWACSAGASTELTEGAVLVLAPKSGDEMMQRLEGELERYLPALSGAQPAFVRVTPGADPAPGGALEQLAQATGAGLVLVFDGDRLAPDLAEVGDPALYASLLEQNGYRLVVIDRGQWKNNVGGYGTTFVLIVATTRLAKQYALYEVLRRLGARFFHPEQEYLPKNDPRQLRLRARTPTVLAKLDSTSYAPDFAPRGYSFHGLHPLEQLESFSDGSFPIDQARRVNEWIVKNRGDQFRGSGRGIASAADAALRVRELDQLRVALGFGRGGGITLHNQQQGAHSSIDSADSSLAKDQIESYVAAQLAQIPDAQDFGIHFGPTEFTVTPDRETVDWINWAGRKAQAVQPGIRVIVNNHITGSQPTPNFDDLGCPTGTNDAGRGDYYDLAFHSDPSFAVKLHTVMFYPLEGPARVYNQQSFAHKLCLVAQASAIGRPVDYFPEGSWWLSFDNPIPVYLPLYLWARGRDVQLLRPYLRSRGLGSVEGHRMFNSGHEWGYWQQDYAVGLWHWNADLEPDQVLGEIFDPLCPPEAWLEGCEARSVAIAVLKETMDHQRQALLSAEDWKGLPGGRYAYLAGEDPADEIGAATGLAFRPVRVAFSIVASWSTNQLAHFKGTDLEALTAMETAYDGFVTRLRAVEAQVPVAGRPWLAEVLDGLENNLLRARHVRQLYQAVIAYREAELAGDDDTAARAAGLGQLQAAAQTLTAAETVIRRREQAYRYPLAQLIAGGDTPETAVENGTTYPFRVQAKTHLLSYWKNRQKQVEALLKGSDQPQTIVLRPAIAPPGTPLAIQWPDLVGVQAELRVGESVIAPTQTSVDLGPAAGYWPVSATLVAGGQTARQTGGIVRAQTIKRTAKKGGLTLVEPASALAQGVLEGVFPALRLAKIDGPTPALVLAPDLKQDGDVAYTDLVHAQLATQAGEALKTLPVDFLLPIPDPATKVAVVQIQLSNVVITGNASLAGPMELVGEMSLSDLAQALVVLAAFDERGAYEVLASVLGFDAASPPPRVPVRATLVLEEPS